MVGGGQGRIDIVVATIEPERSSIVIEIKGTDWKIGASEGSCNPVKLTRPELPIEGDIVVTQAGQLDLHICADNRRGERDLD
jgi:hypothetical protein